jgi:hypothetical protein
VRVAVPSIDTRAGTAALDEAGKAISVEEDSDWILVVMLLKFR